jgi:hypothetical protein
MEDFAERLAEAVGKLQAIKSLGTKNARATHRLLITWHPVTAVSSEHGAPVRDGANFRTV